jgi:hypothetical protein
MAHTRRESRAAKREPRAANDPPLTMGMDLLSCDCCWKSTKHTLRSGVACSRLSTGTGSSAPQCSNANSVSVLISLARAGTPPYRCAAPMEPAMESDA